MPSRTFRSTAASAIARAQRAIRASTACFSSQSLRRGIYCRPVLPRAVAESAQHPLLRELPPRLPPRVFGRVFAAGPKPRRASPLHRAKSGSSRGALRLIEQGALDETSLPELARRVGVGERHLRAALRRRARREPARRRRDAAPAVCEEAADRDGVADYRGRARGRFREPAPLQCGIPLDVRQAAARDPPRARKRRGEGRARAAPAVPAAATISRICSQFLERRVSPASKCVDGTATGAVSSPTGTPGWLSVSPIAGDSALALRVHHAKPSALGEIVARVRRMFDVDADPLAINAHLARSALLKPLVRAGPVSACRMRGTVRARGARDSRPAGQRRGRAHARGAHRRAPRRAVTPKARRSVCTRCFRRRKCSPMRRSKRSA